MDSSRLAARDSMDQEETSTLMVNSEFIVFSVYVWFG